MENSLIARFMGPTWIPPGTERTLFGPIWATWTLLSGLFKITKTEWRIYASINCAIMGSDTDLSPVRHEAIVWTSDCLLLIVHLGTNFSGIRSKRNNFIHTTNWLCKWNLQNGSHFPPPRCVKCHACPAFSNTSLVYFSVNEVRPIRSRYNQGWF